MKLVRQAGTGEQNLNLRKTYYYGQMSKSKEKMFHLGFEEIALLAIKVVELERRLFPGEGSFQRGALAD